MNYLDSLVPKHKLLAWYRPESLAGFANGQNLTNWADSSGNNRNLIVSAAPYPIAQTNAINGYTVVYFNGNVNPLFNAQTVLPKRIIALTRYNGAVFANFAGLITDLGTNGIIIGNTGTNRWFNFNFSQVGDYIYRLDGKGFPETNQVAPVNYVWGLVDVRSDVVFGMSGLQIGQDRLDTTRKYLGSVGEVMFLGEDLTPNEEFDLIAYWALKMRMWQSNLSGTGTVFPFTHDWGIPENFSKNAAVYESPSGSSRIVRVKAGERRASDLNVTDSSLLEKEIAHQFWKDHHPEKPIIIRDAAYSPPKDFLGYTVQNTEFAATPAGYDLWNYSFSFKSNVIN